MPYTLSHAIVALPLHHLTRGKIPLAAVVVGSISPDFPYLLAADSYACARSFAYRRTDLLPHPFFTRIGCVV